MKRWRRDKGEMVTVWKLTMILRIMGVQETSGLETQGQTCILEPSLRPCWGQIGARSLEIRGSVRDSCKSRKELVRREPGSELMETQSFSGVRG